MSTQPNSVSTGLFYFLCLLLTLSLCLSCTRGESPTDINQDIAAETGDQGGDEDEGPNDPEDPPTEDLWAKHIDVNGDGLLHFSASCSDCHKLHSFRNLAFIRSSVSTPNSGDKAVVFLSREGANSYADGDATFDGVCEACHTTLNYHCNTAAGDHSHYSGSSCARCHDHKFEFAPMIGSNSHMRHTGGDGFTELNLACDVCHSDEAGVFQDGLPFATTTVCGNCHSPDGIVDGVDDPVVGARINWASGLYQDGAIPAGKENWCSGCHDVGTSFINGVPAPAVAGNEYWGFSATGHGRTNTITCVDCHDVNAVHIDGQARTYNADLDNHQAAFRLSDVNGGQPLLVPRPLENRINPFSDPPYFELCFQCHDRYALLGGPLAPVGPYYAAEMRTNFRNDSPMVIPDGQGTDISGYTLTGVGAANSHYSHLRAGPPIIYDSDGNGLTESLVSCVTCHNVHGSTSAAMIRDGRLLGHTPGLNFSHVRYDRHAPSLGPCLDPIIMTSDSVSPAESHGGVMRAETGSDKNGVCTFCHCSGGTTTEPEYMINCMGVSCVDYYRTYVISPVPLGFVPK